MDKLNNSLKSLCLLIITFTLVNYTYAQPTRCSKCNKILAKQNGNIECQACSIQGKELSQCLHNGACSCIFEKNLANSDYNLVIYLLGEFIFDPTPDEDITFGDDAGVEPLLISKISKMIVFPDTPKKEIKDWQSKIQVIERNYQLASSLNISNPIKKIIHPNDMVEVSSSSLGDLSKFIKEDEATYYLIVVKHIGIVEFYGLIINIDGNITIISTEEKSSYSLSLSELYLLELMSEHMWIRIYRHI